MARRSSALQVLLNGRRVGRLGAAANGAIDFRYFPEWLAWTHALPISLSLPLDTIRYTGATVTAVFDNLLPDNDNIRRRIAGRVEAGGSDAYSLLAATGRDCVGALQFLPEDEEPLPPDRIDAEPLTDENIATLLGNLARAPLGMEPDDAFRISLPAPRRRLRCSGGRGIGTSPSALPPPRTS